jgi:hypothetical protein
MLTGAIPINTPPIKTTKSKLCSLMVDVWTVLRPVTVNMSIGRVEMHDLQQYIKLLSRIEMLASRKIHEADNADQNSKTHKLSAHAMDRRYMADQGTRPLSRLGSCAMCGHLLVDKLPSNKDIACKDKQIQVKWQTDWMKVKEYTKTGLNPLLDAKGAIVTTLKNPTFGNEVLMCHCWQNFNSAIAAGTECVFNCYDSRSKTQYEAGKCPICHCQMYLCLHKEVSSSLLICIYHFMATYALLAC